MDDSKKYKWGAKKLNYIVPLVWGSNRIDNDSKVCASGLHCGICADSSLLPFSINFLFVGSTRFLFELQSVVRCFVPNRINDCCGNSYMKHSIKAIISELPILVVAAIYVGIDPVC